MAISYVAAGTAFTRVASGTSFTWNKPAGVVSGDLMVASAACFPGGPVSATLPSGWTLLELTYDSGASGGDTQQVVAYRLAGSSEPASWAGSWSGSAQLTTAAVVAYRGAQTVSASGDNSISGGSSLSTGSISTGSVAGPRRVVCGSYGSSTDNYTISSNETTRRILFTSNDEGGAGVTQSAIWDSNATTISTGTTTSRTVSRGAAWSQAVACILIIQPQTGTPATGTATVTIGEVSASAAATVSVPATVSATVPSVTSAFEGLGQPLVGTGTMSTTTPAITSSAAGLTDVRGTLDTILPIGVDIEGETRAHGVRVINVPADDRTIQVESRAVAD